MYVSFNTPASIPRRALCAVPAMIMIMVAFVFGGTTGGRAEDAKPAGDATALWSASFKDLTGNMQKFDGLKGKLAVVYFWATWCEPCVKEGAELKALYENNHAKGLEVLGIAMDNADKVKDFVAKNGLPYQIVYGGREAIQLSKDLGNSVGGIPFLVIIGPDGKIAERIIGESKGGTIAAKVAALLPN